MKAYHSVVSGLRRSFRGAALTGALLVLGFTAMGAPPTPNSPAGTWGRLLTGSGQQGIAFLTFSDDGTFSGYC